MRRLFSLVALCSLASLATAAEPAGFYTPAEGLSGPALRNDIFLIDFAASF